LFKNWFNIELTTWVIRKKKSRSAAWETNILEEQVLLQVSRCLADQALELSQDDFSPT
jgi:hypothetical protein